MPIVVTLDVMLAKRKMSLTELSQAVGVTLGQLSLLKTEKALAIRFTTLDRICITLSCQPADLMHWVTEEEYKQLKRL
jgi:putative transcriptional regulator